MEYTQQQVVIANGASKSSWTNIMLGYRLVGVLVPAAVEGDSLRFYADPVGNDSTGAIVVNGAGEQVEAKFGTLPSYIDCQYDAGTKRGKIPPAARYAVESVTTSAAQNQTGAATITLVLVREGPVS